MHYSERKNHSKLRTVGVHRVGNTDAVMSYFNPPIFLFYANFSMSWLINCHFLNQNQNLLSCTRPYAPAAQKAATRRRLSLPSSSQRRERKQPQNGVGEPLKIPQCSLCRCLPPNPTVWKERMCAIQGKQNHEKLLEIQNPHLTCELDSNAELFDG